MASTETSHNNNEDTVLSILKDIRDLLGHQEGRIKRLEDDHAPTLPESPLKLSKSEKGEPQDSEPSGSEHGNEMGELTQRADDQTRMALSHPSQHLDEVPSAFSSGLSRPQSDSGPPPSNDNVDGSGVPNQLAEDQTDVRPPSSHLDEVASTSSSGLPQPQSNSGPPPSNEEDNEDGGSIQPPGEIGMRPSSPSQHLDEVASTSSHSPPQPQSNSGQQKMAIAPAEPQASEQINPANPIGRKVTRLPPLDPDVHTKLPMSLISWLSKIPDDKRLRFGFTLGSLASLPLTLLPGINPSRWELDVYRKEKRLEQRLIDVHHYLPNSASINAAFGQFNRLTPGYGIQFFVRDNDLDGNNRLYQPSILLEYRDNPSGNPGIIQNTPPPLQYGDYFGDDIRKSTWDQHPQAAPMMHVPSNGRNEEQENQDALKRRIVVLRGIESALIPAYRLYDRYDDLDMLFTDTWGFILNHLKGNQSWEDQRYLKWRILNIQLCGYKMHDSSMYEHILPLQGQESQAIETAKEHPVRPRDEYVPRIEYHRWKTGKMYEFEGQQLTKQVYTVAAIYSGGNWNWDEVGYWTLLFAGPVGGDPLETENPVKELAFGVLPALPSLLLRQATLCLSSIREGYEQLLDKIESNLGDRDGILDPDNHGKLLIEDQSFERSRRYFWTIDALDTFSGTLKESIKTFEQFMDALWRASERFQEGMWDRDTWDRDRGKKEITEANLLLERIKAIKERTITLRDGVRTPYILGYQYLETGLLLINSQLFNASSVFESRASTRLGETVKLLTYVTIFYLPLAFCATLWAVPDNFGGMHIFAIVITTVSLATYIIVFNLNHLTFYLITLHQHIRGPLTNWMDLEQDDNGKPTLWTERGRRFRRWKPGQPEPAPSEWLILWYGLFCVARVFGIIQLAGIIARAANFFKNIVGKFKRRREVTSGENSA